MKIYLFNYKLFILAIYCLLLSSQSFSQKDSSFLKRISADTSKLKINADAVYNRPFLQLGKTPIAIGGYMEANSHFEQSDGVNEGLSFQFRRLTIFMSSTITKKIKFLSELEFEDGTKEINIEFAAIDFEFHPFLNLRGGIIMNPIGAFNQNHDGPKWEFIDRPISATQMLPATFSNAGFGIHGKLYKSNWVMAYEAYLTNGFDESIIANEEGKTLIPAVKENEERFEESFNGQPLLTTKIAIRNRNLGELGLSYMGGVYNKYIAEGIVLDAKRRADVYAIDMNTVIPKINTSLTGEFAWVFVNLPDDYIEQFGNRQHGGFLDIVQPLFKRKIFGWQNASFNAALRLEYVDWNIGTFNETDINIYEHIYSFSTGISFRPSGQMVLRLNYRQQWQRDILGNPSVRTAMIQFGVSGYF
jgi:hypothetical protein